MNNPQIDHLGNKYWRNEKGRLHREDGPAIEYANGNKSWYKNGKLHREDGPSFEHINGYKEWHIEGKYYLEESGWKEAFEVYCLNKGIKSIFTIQKEADEEKQRAYWKTIKFPKEYETIEL